MSVLFILSKRHILFNTSFYKLFSLVSQKMLNLFKIKGQKKEEAANTNGRPPAKKQSPGELRLHKGLFLQKFFFYCITCVIWFLAF